MLVQIWNQVCPEFTEFGPKKATVMQIQLPIHTNGLLRGTYVILLEMPQVLPGMKHLICAVKVQ